MAEIDFNLINQTFAYKNGNLYRKMKTSKTLKKCEFCRKDGYLQVQINRKKYLAHRIIFFMFYGYLPLIVDHIDNNPLNNNISNLRATNRYGNTRNAKIPKTNTSGYKGVSWHKRVGKWRTQIRINNKTKNLGYFDDVELAGLVAEEARQKYYKEFAREK